MKPLSPRIRRLYLLGLTVLFLVSAPVILLYSSGYRYNEEFGIVRTGGIYLSIPYADATLSLNGEVIGATGFLNRSFYIDDLAPSAYAVHVAREDSHAWYRTLVVEPSIVTRADVILVPDDAVLVRLARGTSVREEVRSVAPQTYDAYLAAFREWATSTASIEQEEDFTILIEQGNIYAAWLNPEQNPPDNFCTAPSSCASRFAVESGRQTALSVVLFRGGVVYATREGGVFFSEIDARPTAVSVPLYAKAGAGVRVVGGELIIRDGDVLYAVEGF